MDAYVERSRAEAVQELAAALLKTAGEVMTRHGDDPMGEVIVAAGFGMALDRIGEHIAPNIPRIVRELLARER